MFLGKAFRVETVMSLEWKAEYETGYDRIDWEHRVFLDLVAEFAAEAREGSDHALVIRLAQEIYKYADFHFFSEERVMAKIGYPGAEAHCREHRRLLEELREYVGSISTDMSQASEMAGFFVRWFVSHTTTEDHKLAESVAEHRRLCASGAS